MPRHTFLDAILNRPSQSYAPGSEGNLSHAQQQRTRNWSSPPDLPNAPRQFGGSILNGGSGRGSIFRRTSKANLSNLGSDAGTTSTRTTLRSRFRRKKRDSVSLNEFGGSQYAPSNADDSMQRSYPPPPSSVADSQTYGTQQRKGRWWEAGGAFSIGRRSRAPSIAGDSIFSEPEPQPGQVPWTAHGLAGIGAGQGATSPRRATRSDYGSPTRSRLNQSSIPPVPSLPPVPRAPSSQAGSSSGRSPGRIQTGVAPLGASTLNPTLQRKPSKSKASNVPSAASPPAANSIRKTSSSSRLNTTRATSPAPSLPSGSTVARVPGALASSPHIRRLSQDGKTAKRASSVTSGGGGDGSDWKDFVKSLSGSEISKTWAGIPNAPDMQQAAVKGRSTSNVERRKSHYERVAKELQQDAQFEQTIRDPGIVHQDLLARAASQVVGSPPPGLEGADYVGQLQPGSVIIPPSGNARQIPQQYQYDNEEREARPRAGSGQSQLTTQNMQQHTAVVHQQHVEDIRRKAEEERGAAKAADTTEESEEDSSEDDDDEEGSDEDSAAHKQTMLEAVREEDEDANSSVGADSRRHTLVSNDAHSAGKAPSVDEHGEPRYKAFAAALNKSRFSGPNLANGSPALNGVPLASNGNREESVTAGLDDDEAHAVQQKSPGTPRIELNSNELPEDVVTPDEKLTHTYLYHSDGGGNASEDNDVYQDARSTASDNYTPLLTEDMPPLPALPLLHQPVPRPTHIAQRRETDDEEVMADDENDEAERRSNQSGQTGRATVTFDKTANASKDERSGSDETIDANGDARSTRSSLTRGSRPATLQRRLSDLSLGTSFGVSNIMRIGQSRSSSSRRIKMNDDDQDSAGSNSDGDDNEDLRARIRAEQERLRNMKVGDDFFGGSLSEILDKFDSTNWDERISSGITQQLDLDIGSAGLKGGSAALGTDQDVLNKNAQERILEVRRMRSDGGTPSKRRQELSETRTVESGIAPSFAALWLLNQAGESGSAETMGVAADETTSQSHAEDVEVLSDTHHKRTGSMGSSDDATTTMTHNSPSSRLRIFFTGKDSTAPSAQQSPEKPTTSVLNRPRQRAPRPKEMGGVSIAQGKLAADSREERLEEVRLNKPSVWTAQTLSQMKEAKEQEQQQEKALTDAASTTHGSETAVSPPSSPVAKVKSSKDRPAPLKSAIKGGGKLKHSKSLADTLFSFSHSADNSSKLKKRTRSEKSVDSASTVKGKGKQAAATAEEKARSAEEVKQSTPQVTSAPAPVAASKASPKPDALSEPSSQHVDAVRAPKPVRAEHYPINLQAEANEADEDDAMQASPQEWRSNVHADTHELDSARSPPPVSEHWSGESAVSTGPITPGASDILDHRGMGTLPRRGFSPAYLDDGKGLPASPRDKKLPLPPVPTFEGEEASTYAVYEDQTPLAVSRSEPAYTEFTPRAERDQPSFGLNLIPPTPPAEDIKYTLNTQLHDMPLRTPPTLAEEDEDPLAMAGDAVSQQSKTDSDMQRSTSTRSKKSDAGLTRKSSTSSSTATKRRSSVPNGLGEFHAQGLSLPPGLVATTVATSSSRQQDYPVSADPTAKSRKGSKGKKSKRSKDIDDGGEPSRPFVAMAPQSALATGSAPMQQSLSASLASLAPPRAGQSDTSSSRGSDSMRRSTSSPSPSPAVSASGRSSAVSSSAASDTSSSRNAAKHTNHLAGPPRSIRTTTAGPNGHARTSLMSAISEWESSPVDEYQQRHSPNSLPRSGYASPVPYAAAMMPHSASGYASPTAVYQSPSYATHSQSSVQSGLSPSIVRNAPIGAPTDAMLQPSAASAYPSDAGANRRLSVPMAESVDGHQQGRGVYGGSYLGHGESEYSLGAQSQQSVLSLPAVPQSSYRARDPLKASNTIDDRLYAKTTMSTISVTSGAFRKGSRSRRPSIDPTTTATQVGEMGGVGRRASIDTLRDQVMAEELHRTTMSMTSHTPPPRKLSSTQVLVQVIACAIDDMDRLLLRERVRNETAYGFVPGRSFCGRVMETGWEVKRMRKGDIVFGLQTSRKCGALAEFMTIEESLTAKAPQDCLTMEQIAALPSVGVVAHQLMINHCSQLKRGSRILILNAHDGVGLLTMQECSSLGLIIVAHCPNQVSDGVAICEANGAHEVIIGEPLWALNSLHESSFDMVVDTVGGRRVYDAARRILAFEGQFCTSIGDLQSAVANPNLRSHLRSLRRSFFKKDTKRIGYEWVGTDTAEDCREALEAVQRAAESGLICPRLKSVLAFAEAPRAFENTLRNAEEEPGAVVVRIS